MLKKLEGMAPAPYPIQNRVKRFKGKRYVRDLRDVRDAGDMGDVRDVGYDSSFLLPLSALAYRGRGSIENLKIGYMAT